MVRIHSTDGRRFEIRTLGRTTWGDEQLEFLFDLGWANGKVEFVCSKDRLAKLQESLDKHHAGEEINDCFINEDGNLEITLTGLSTGLCRFQIIAIPKMTDDDRIEFSFEGTVEA